MRPWDNLPSSFHIDNDQMSILLGQLMRFLYVCTVPELSYMCNILGSGQSELKRLVDNMFKACQMYCQGDLIIVLALSLGMKYIPTSLFYVGWPMCR